MWAGLSGSAPEAYRVIAWKPGGRTPSILHLDAKHLIKLKSPGLINRQQAYKGRNNQ
jgi:hypothetical protein